MSRRQTVVIADDHASTRAVIRMSLEDSGFAVVGEATNGPDAVTLALQHHPDLCLLDVHMPGGDGLTAAGELEWRLPATSCVVLTVSEDPADLVAALSYGVSGFLPKSASLAQIGEILQRVGPGETLMPTRLVAHLAASWRDAGRDVATAGAGFRFRRR